MKISFLKGNNYKYSFNSKFINYLQDLFILSIHIMKKNSYIKFGQKNNNIQHFLL